MQECVERRLSCPDEIRFAERSLCGHDQPPAIMGTSVAITIGIACTNDPIMGVDVDE